MVVSRNETVLIVGAGCFGLSTAYHLLQKGFTDVTVLDRSEKLPAPDAASTDMNKSESYDFLCVPKNDSDKKVVWPNHLQSCTHILFRYILRATGSRCHPRVEEDRRMGRHL